MAACFCTSRIVRTRDSPRLQRTAPPTTAPFRSFPLLSAPFRSELRVGLAPACGVMNMSRPWILQSVRRDEHVTPLGPAERAA
eukprot:1196092-Prorocentrum_minimum.AAC.3